MSSNRSERLKLRGPSLLLFMGRLVGMTGYVLSVNNMGASIGAVASAIFPAIGAVLAGADYKELLRKS